MRVEMLRWPVLVVGVVSIVLWGLSYSWLVGVTPPTQWISRSASPWLIAEIAAVVTGALAVLGGGLLARRFRAGTRRTALWAAGLGGFATVATLVSLAMPA